MSHVYSQRLLDVARNSAKEIGITLRKAFICSLAALPMRPAGRGETCKILGADAAVGMSTTIEAIAANHMGVKFAVHHVLNTGCPESLTNRFRPQGSIGSGDKVSIFEDL